MISKHFKGTEKNIRFFLQMSQHPSSSQTQQRSIPSIISNIHEPRFSPARNDASGVCDRNDVLFAVLRYNNLNPIFNDIFAQIPDECAGSFSFHSPVVQYDHPLMHFTHQQRIHNPFQCRNVPIPLLL